LSGGVGKIILTVYRHERRLGETAV
jgi:hypothetical protein